MTYCKVGSSQQVERLNDVCLSWLSSRAVIYDNIASTQGPMGPLSGLSRQTSDYFSPGYDIVQYHLLVIEDHLENTPLFLNFMLFGTAAVHISTVPHPPLNSRSHPPYTCKSTYLHPDKH